MGLRAGCVGLLCLCVGCGAPTATRETRGGVLQGAGVGVPASAGAASGSGVAGAAGTAGLGADNNVGLVQPTGGPAPGSNGVPNDPCSDAAKLIYVVDEDGRFSSFNPGTNPPSFADVLRGLDCPAKSADPFGIFKPTPYSMAVDRSAVAWVLYSSGELFSVDTATGSCRATTFQPNQSGFMLMGMGFVANSAMGKQDTLYVAGGAGVNTGTSSRLGTIDMNTLAVTPTQPLSGWPELTGTGLAELWGFYPDTSPPKVARLDKISGVEEKVFPLAALQGEPAAWAFAFWGGDFWVFLMRDSDTDTTVYRVNGSTGTMSVALANTGRHIVGAGVSTCAPVNLQ